MLSAFWSKKGDQIAKGQGIIELETGKAVAPVPSPAAGKVTKILVSVGDKISVGQPILSLEAARARPAAAKPAEPHRLRGQARSRPLRLRAADRRRKTAPEADEETLRPTRQSPSLRRPSGGWRGNWASICDEFTAATMAAASSWTTCAPTSSACNVWPPSPAATGRQSRAKRPEQIDFSKWGPIAKRPDDRRCAKSSPRT